jgi:hypothetical protein
VFGGAPQKVIYQEMPIEKEQEVPKKSAAEEE